MGALVVVLVGFGGVGPAAVVPGRTAVSPPEATALGPVRRAGTDAYKIGPTGGGKSLESAPGLIGAFSFDEGSGSYVGDSSGHGLSGTVVNAAWSAAGRFGKALSFNGKSSLVSIPLPESVTFRTALSLEAWVYPSSIRRKWADAIYRATDAFYLEAQSTPSGAPAVGGTFGGRNTHVLAPSRLVPGRWSFLAGTYDGSTIRLYVNGRQVASAAIKSRVSPSTSPLEIGGDSTYGQFFKGKIDQVRIYDRALTAARIRNDMTTPVAEAPGADVSHRSGPTLKPAVLALTPGRTVTFGVDMQGKPRTPIVWSVNGVRGGSPQLGTISDLGVYTASKRVGVRQITAAVNGRTALAQVNVTNYPGTFSFHNDNARDGANLHETVLTPANVRVSTFGKLFSYPLDGLTFASPLYVENVDVPGKGLENVVYVATEHDSVYAFDADGRIRTPLWRRSFIDPAAGVTTVPAIDTRETGDIPGEIGITGTPVIDRASNTLYVVSATKEVSAGKTVYVQRLHALDLGTGAEKLGGPVEITASVPGTGLGARNGRVSFNTLRENQRTGLLLSNGVVYFAFSGHGIIPPYHGWVLGYDATTLKQVMVYCTSPDDEQAGVWMGGDGIAADASGAMYFATGNGPFDVSSGGSDYGDSVVKLKPDGTVASYFTPHEEKLLAAGDVDLGSGGVLLLPDQPGPHRHLLVAGGKSGTVYLLNRDALGQFHAGSDSQIVQSLPAIFPGGTYETGNYSSPAYYRGSVYWSPVNSPVEAFRLRGGRLSSSPTSRSSETFKGDSGEFFGRGGTLAISANGGRNGIVWALQSHGDRAPGVLHAYAASDLAYELYNSRQAGARDLFGPWLKFTVPLVANGMVYVVSAHGLTAFGLLP